MKTRSAPGLAGVSHLAIGILLNAPLSAQSQVFAVPGDVIDDNFAWSVAGNRDIDGDGLPDVMASGYRASTGRIKVHSGATGVLLLHIVGAPSARIGYESTFVDDVNSDGVPDILASSFNDAIAQVYSGANGSLLLSLTTQFSTAGVAQWPDEDGDGMQDFQIGAQIFSSQTGSVLRTLVLNGNRLLPAGDVNGDGMLDYVEQNLFSGSGTVRSGLDDSILHSIAGTGPGMTSGIGDINGDGFDDIITYREFPAGGLSPGYSLRSGTNGSVLYELLEEMSFFNTLSAQGTSRMVGMGDMDGDGCGDFVLDTLPPKLFSGKTGCLLAEFIREETASIPFSIANAGDIDGDGDNDVIYGSPTTPVPMTMGGSAAVFHYDGPVGTNYCTPVPNSTGLQSRLHVSGSASVSKNNLVLAADSMPAHTTGIFLYGGAQVQILLNAALLCVGPGSQGSYRIGLGFSSSSACLVHHVDLTNPPGPNGQVLPGSQWNYQAWFRDTQGIGVFNFSDAVNITFTP